MPSLRAVLMMRQAISPRLAIRIFLNMHDRAVRKASPLATADSRRRGRLGGHPLPDVLGRHRGLVHQGPADWGESTGFPPSETSAGPVRWASAAVAADPAASQSASTAVTASLVTISIFCCVEAGNGALLVGLLLVAAEQALEARDHAGDDLVERQVAAAVEPGVTGQRLLARRARRSRMPPSRSWRWP